MESKSMVGMVIVILGGLFLFKNLGIISATTFKLLWPLIIIGIGILALYLTTNQKGEFTSKVKVQIGDWETDNPIVVRLAIAIVSIFVVIVVGFVLVGVLAPVFLLLLLLIPFILVIVLGATLLPILIPVFLLLAPILLIVWLLSLFF